MTLPKINAYQFGKMEIDHRVFSNDLIIFPNGNIQGNWRRKSGHRISIKDIETMVLKKPKMLIAGTGAHDRMVPEPAVLLFLRDIGIEFHPIPTAEAVELFNQKRHDAIKMCACFHLTC